MQQRAGKKRIERKARTTSPTLDVRIVPAAADDADARRRVVELLRAILRGDPVTVE